jgi:hypothetical protein
MLAPLNDMSAPKPRREPVSFPLDLNRLRALLGSNPLAKSVLEFAARVQPPQLSELSTVDRLHKALKEPTGRSWPRRRLIRSLRELAQAGCGHLRVGRHGSPSRFQWKAAPAELVKRPELGLASAPAMPLPTAVPTAPVRPGPEPRLMQHVFHLRPDQQVTFLLPKDLTEKEADRLARFITTLPFG